MQRIFYTQAFVLGIIAILYFYFGLSLRFFWTVFWWDILLHMLGGLWVALAASFFLRLHNAPVTLLLCVCAALVVGAGWELFEYVLDIGGSAFMSYPADTLKDIVDDAIGGAVAYFIVRQVDV